MPKVFIGVGHGGKDGGAAAAGLVERDVNLIMATACATTLQAAGVSVRMSRTTNTETDTVSQEVAECRAYKPDVAIEIHNNAGGGDGFEVFTNREASSLQLTEYIQREVLAIGQNSRGLKYNSNLAWTKQQGYPVVLCEGFFLDNAKDRQLFDTVAEQQRLGVAYAKGILKYLGVPLPSAAEQFVLLLDGEPVEVVGQKFNGNYYIKLRELSKLFPCEVGYNMAKAKPYVKTW